MNMENKRQSSINQASSVDKARRKVTKAGLVSPIILSLASKPVWAENCTLSGMLSGNASNPGREAACPLPGLSKEFWFNNQDCWPTPFSPNSIFDAFFKTEPYPPDSSKTGTLYGLATFAQVLQAGIDQNFLMPSDKVACDGDAAPTLTPLLRSDLGNVAAECCAAVLNAQALPFYSTAAMSGSQVVQSFREAYTDDRTGCKMPNQNVPSAMSALAAVLLAFNNPWNP